MTFHRSMIAMLVLIATSQTTKALDAAQCSSDYDGVWMAAPATCVFVVRQNRTVREAIGLVSIS